VENWLENELLPRLEHPGNTDSTDVHTVPTVGEAPPISSWTIGAPEEKIAEEKIAEEKIAEEKIAEEKIAEERIGRTLNVEHFQPIKVKRS